MPKTISTVLLAGALTLLACGKPLPADKKDYEGMWTNDQMTLVIWSSGKVRYLRKQGRSSKKINAPIKKFVGPDFVVGIGPVDTTFHVSRPPYQERGERKMVVDGQVLVRRGSASSAPAEEKDVFQKAHERTQRRKARRRRTKTW